MERDVQVVILAGGKGMRMREFTETMPKALVRIGQLPVIQHVINIYAKAGFRRFLISTGYKGEMLSEFFESNRNKDQEVICMDTGAETQTGGRVKLLEKHIDSEDFMATYCDGLADADMGKLLDFHRKHGRIGTLTAVHPMSPFGMLDIGRDDIVQSFREKPQMKDYINGGFFAFRKEFLGYIAEGDVLEEAPMRKLTHEKQLVAFRHEGFWTCMDTFKDVERLNALWFKGEMPHTGYKGKPPWV
jgi:glucose-1-phosphate cytidylyltransferase